MSDGSGNRDLLADTYRHLVAHKTVVLTVEINTLEDAEQIMRWFAAPEKPMSAVLKEISWNKAVVSKEVAAAIDTIREALQ